MVFAGNIVANEGCGKATVIFLPYFNKAVGLTEKIGQALNKKYTNAKYMAVRFGNVLGSRSGVVPLFKKQLAAGDR